MSSPTMLAVDRTRVAVCSLQGYSQGYNYLSFRGGCNTFSGYETSYVGICLGHIFCRKGGGGGGGGRRKWARKRGSGASKSRYKNPPSATRRS